MTRLAHNLLISAVIIAGTCACHAYALTPARNGSLVEISDCKIDWWPWSDTVAIRCDYRVNEGEWKHLQGSKVPEYPEMFLPGTSVHLAVIDGYFYAQFDEDVRELRWIQ